MQDVARQSLQLAGCDLVCMHGFALLAQDACKQPIPASIHEWCRAVRPGWRGTRAFMHQSTASCQRSARGSAHHHLAHRVLVGTQGHLQQHLEGVQCLGIHSLGVQQCWRLQCTRALREGTAGEQVCLLRITHRTSRSRSNTPSARRSLRSATYCSSGSTNAARLYSKDAGAVRGGIWRNGLLELVWNPYGGHDVELEVLMLCYSFGSTSAMKSAASHMQGRW
jgi:hypothetical protein